MVKKTPLKPSDFPVEADDKTIIDHSGKPIADACDRETANDIAERLNSDEARNEEDRWSA